MPGKGEENTPGFAACGTLPPLIYQAHRKCDFSGRGINILGQNGSPSVGLPSIQVPVVWGPEMKVVGTESSVQLPMNFIQLPMSTVPNWDHTIQGQSCQAKDKSGSDKQFPFPCHFTVMYLSGVALISVDSSPFWSNLPVSGDR